MSDSFQRVTEEQVRRELRRTGDRQAGRRAWIAAAVVLALAAALGAAAVKFQFALVDVRSDAMEGGLRSGDIVACVRAGAPLLARPARRGDVALVRFTDNGLQRQALRRVIALAGDELSVDEDGRVTLNGQALEETYALYRSGNDWNGGVVVPGGALENPFATSPVQTAPVMPTEDRPMENDLEYPITVPESKLFVLCDNRENAMDSRSSRFGLVDEADIQGLARAIVWPVYRTALLDGE